MPPKKKSNPARRVSTGKRVRIADSIMVSSPTTRSGRSTRRVAGNINYRIISTRAPNDPAKKLAKSREDASAPRAAKTAPAETPKRRGRPPKAAVSATDITASAEPDTTSNPAKKGRGRPKKTETVVAPAVRLPKRKREEVDEDVSAPAKKRGRPAKSTATTPTSNLTKKLPAVKVRKDAPKTKSAAKPAARRGRPPKADVALKPQAKSTAKNYAKAKTPKNAVETETEDFVEGMTQPEAMGDAPDYQYWLMKAEPDTRLEKGVNVAYPIDRLAAATEPEPWDGVRNPVARNNMRAMRKGDLAFFYHSNCKQPGIVGVMRIAEEHSVDESAFDPTHPYYDEKSDRRKPKWDCVKVEHVKKFNDIIDLKTLKSTPELSQMQIASKAFSRLSVQKVTPDQWRFVLKMANEPEDLGIVSPVSGYEADTNGETDKETEEESVGLEADTANKVEAQNLAAYGSPDDLMDKETTNYIDAATNIQPTLSESVNGIVSAPASNRMTNAGKEDSTVGPGNDA